MRNRLLLLTAAVVLSACADDQHTTAPASRSVSSSRSAAGDLGTATQTTGSPQAKPIDQVGFTKITTVNSDLIHAVAGQNTGVVVSCPAGSTAIGGGYSVTLYLAGATPPFTKFMGLDGQNGWGVDLSNDPVGAKDFTYYASVYCAS